MVSLLSGFLFGDYASWRRSKFPGDNLYTIKTTFFNKGKQHNFSGETKIIPETKETKNKIVYSIDDVVTYETPSEEIRKECTNKLKERQYVSAYVVGFGTVIFGATTYLIWRDWDIGANLWIKSGSVLSAALVGLEGYTIHDINSELEKWKNKIDDYVNLRKLIPTFRINELHNKKLRKLLYTEDEGVQLWIDSFKKTNEEFEVNASKSASEQKKFIESAIKNYALKYDIVKYFEIESLASSTIRKILPKVKKEFDAISTEFHTRSDLYNQKKDLLKREKKLEKGEVALAKGQIQGVMDEVKFAIKVDNAANPPETDEEKEKRLKLEQSVSIVHSIGTVVNEIGSQQRQSNISNKYQQKENTETLEYDQFLLLKMFPALQKLTGEVVKVISNL